MMSKVVCSRKYAATIQIRKYLKIHISHKKGKIFSPYDEHEISLNHHSFSIVAQTSETKKLCSGWGQDWQPGCIMILYRTYLFKGVKNDITTYKVENYVAYI